MLALCGVNFAKGSSCSPFIHSLIRKLRCGCLMLAFSNLFVLTRCYFYRIYKVQIARCKVFYMALLLTRDAPVVGLDE